ncbi:SDR family oxidoreductase [Roseibium salinum]|uniref:SDR family oxidoreductase n=1 Tax=Roseibium salinum TaxID=1604349 RepID=A0ABT3R0W2_9HYPH|nr:SDR family oxidoreductase [Roseibium sp. DSM 29163]MCX2722874.1 SDR family oxidoreductase [Roseibium sp. DSM 29163]MDN3719200.1 SDR family oxidoreductase [Roseibium salinum]
MTDQSSKPVAVVTGAAGDIGTAIAARLAVTHRVVAVDIDDAALKVAASKLNCAGADAIAVQCDVTKPDDLSRMAETARQAGGVNALINNAGGGAALSLHSMTADTLSRDLALNLEAALNCFKVLETALVASRAGTVINIVSVNGLGTFGHPAYSAAKAGLIHATRALAIEYGRYGLRANAVAPGTVKTQAWKARQEANPAVFDEALSWYPFKTLPEPDDIAAAVAFLLSPAARCITGICLPVDSGLSAGSPALARTFTQSPDFDGQ